MIKLARWSYMFRSAVYARGVDYFQRRLVRSFNVDENIITAEVGNDEVYHVQIELDERGHIKKTFCGCPYAQEGLKCKHMAATLLKYENEYVISSAADQQLVHPFRESFRDGGYFYDLDHITRDFQISSGLLKQAQELVNSEQMEMTDIHDGFEPRGRRQILQATGSYRDERTRQRHEVHLTLSRDDIVEYSCDGVRCRSYSSRQSFYLWSEHRHELCCHELALLLLMEVFILAVNPGDSTDLAGMQLIHNIAGAYDNMDNQTESGEILQLEPRLEYGGHGLLKLGFRMGPDKLYVVRNLRAMAEACSAGERFELTAKRTVDFGRAGFSDDAMRYYRLIENAVSEEQARDSIRRIDYSSGNDSRFFNIGSSILLYGTRLDEFFDAAGEDEVELTDTATSTKERRMITMVSGRPQMDLTISDVWSAREFDGIRLHGHLPEVLQGARYSYLVESDHLLRIDSDFYGFIQNLRSDSYGNEIDLRIGRKHLPEFYHHVLPVIRQKTTVYENNRSLIEEYIPPKAEFTFYLDAGDGMVSCRCVAIYGDQNYDMARQITPLEICDTISERKVTEVLERYFTLENETYVCPADDESLFALLEDGISEMMKYGEVHSTDAFDRLKVKRKMKVTVGVSVDNNLLELDIKTDDIPMEELAEIISSYRQKKKFHKLRSGEFVRIDDENIESLEELLSTLNISLKDFVSGHMHIPSYRALYLDRMLEKNEVIYDHRDTHFRNMVRDFKTIKESDYEVPESLQDIMRGYQKLGYKWLKTLSHFGFGGILADEMGLGKTVQMIAVLLDHKHHHPGETSLVVCPASLVFNWVNEFRKFAPEMDVISVVGTQNERKSIINDYGCHDVLITSYDLLKRDIDLYEDVTFAYEILDEAQYIKTHTTANARSCKAISAVCHFALTGTPIENNLSELWSIFDFLMPGFLYSYETFRNRFEVRIARDGDQKASDRLKQMIAPFILRRRKMDVLTDLPEKIEETVKVKFEPRQQQLYDSQVLKMTSSLQESSDEKFTHNKIAILAELMRIRQICCEPSLVFEDFGDESAKRQACLELIHSAIDEGHKILLFSQFTSMLEVLEKQLQQEGIEYYKITGQTKKEERVALVERFNGDEVPLFLISLKAGGTGLNLTGADIVIHYDPWWNVAAQNQATDRAHRIGQEKIVSVYRIIAEGTIEEKIVELQEKKSQLAETLLSGDSVSISTLTRDELLQLLSGR